MTRINAVILSLAVLALGACNTISGAGEDLSAGGEAISDTAQDTQREITD